MSLLDIFSKQKPENQSALTRGLSNTKRSLWDRIHRLARGKSQIDEELLDDLEEALIAADVGIATTVKIIQRMEARVARDKYVDTAELNNLLQEEIALLLDQPKDAPPKSSIELPHIILVVGVNGSGKTTTTGKLAMHYKKLGKQVVIGAADTFRAAAVEQLQQWGKRAGAEVIKNQQHKDPSSVAYEAVKKGIENKADIVLIDTAGRLHTKTNLMHELAKIGRVVQKLVPTAPHETLLVLDGSTGQNALVQAKVFTQAIPITALAITKLDGTAKGGIVLAIVDQLNVPVRYVGLGEGVDDLQAFDKEAFVRTLFNPL